MYGIAGPLEQLRMRAESAEQEAKRAQQQARMWKAAAFVWMFVGMLFGFMAGRMPAIAAEPPVQPTSVTVECWRLDAIGERRLVWRATGRAAWTELRGDIDVVVVEQEARRVEVEVVDGVACFVRTERLQ